ncbi:uncharacterized protein IL334_007449 [Kwoniella shivajii]|uniref:Carboxylic ester hydrolase n=1 Tax=Kwoniella shivajii TaxID=564305 RepID=A0ABZ1D8P6_9TREE|nr:hypothetical protein IL334_007449 [Kwoniella shivajii]
MIYSSITALIALVAITAPTTAWTIDQLCDASFISSCLPDNAAPGVVIDSSSLTSYVANHTMGSTILYFCNVTFAYSHAGLNDRVQVNYFVPDESYFAKRYLSTGGGGLAINSGPTAGYAGLPYGAVTGRTDGGFDSFTNQYNTNGVDLLANGTLNYEELFLFGYQAHHEMALLGQKLTQNVYGLGNETKLYSYYSGCSEGGREGWSQVQRFGDQFDGALLGAPAFRYAQQQTIGYVPAPCELSAILNATIAACDPLDGRVDGVVSRSDLCQLSYNVSTLIGTSYNCAAEAPLPAQSGIISAQAIEVVQTILNGLKDSDGKQVYFSWQPAASFADATPTTFNDSTGLWDIPGLLLAAPTIQRLVNLVETNSLSLDGVTYDTLRDWIIFLMQKYYDTMQTTWPDLTPFYEAGGKVIHYHGESDNSIPTASSVRYYESVASIMYPGMSFNDSHSALGEWYRLFLIPGAGHCAPNTFQPNGPFPQAPLTDLISWVEKGVKPVTLNATVTKGPYKGNQPICAWPLRPLWNVDDLTCVYDQTSIDTWMYNLDAYKFPVY